MANTNGTVRRGSCATEADEAHFDAKARGRVSRNRVTVHQPTTLDQAQSPRYRTEKKVPAKTKGHGIGEKLAEAIEEELAENGGGQ